jgi:RHS repeat-associated protein
MDAKYFYYAHGPLARVEIGDSKVQGMDYVYTLQGWIKGVNSNILDPNNDVGKDGLQDTTNANRNFAKDAFSYSLGYYQGDYTPINTTAWSNVSKRFIAATPNSSNLMLTRNDLFNGNISSMVTSIVPPTMPKPDSLVFTSQPQGASYKYDQLNRLIEMQAYQNIDVPSNTWQGGATYAGMYNNIFSYDANGNILTQLRKNQSGTSINDLNYKRFKDVAGQTVQNRLYHVKDAVSATSFTDDIDDQGYFHPNLDSVKTDNNYSYDEIGNLIKNKQKDIALIKWTVYGKVDSVARVSGSSKRNLKFRYNANGERVSKHVYTSAGAWLKSEYYVRDASGSVMSIYKNENVTGTGSQIFNRTETNIYGSSRIGVDKTELKLVTPPPMDTVYYSRTLGNKEYEGSNHLGNVLTTFTDRKLPIDANYDAIVDAYWPHVISSSDYYPFGVTMKERTYSSSTSRYKFNGKEYDEETETSDFGARLQDGDLGIWFSMDRLSSKYPSFSAYNFALNNPLIIVDVDGEDVFIIGKVNGKEQSIKFEPGSNPPKGADNFVKDSYKALNGKINAGEGEHIAALANDKSVDLSLKYGEKSYYKDGVVNWNNNEGFVAVQYENPDKPKRSKRILNLEDKGTIFSPADIVEHEFGHAKHDLIDNTLDNDREQKSTKNKGYTNLEEQKTIDEYDNNGGQFRKSHGGIPFKAKNVLDKSGEIILDKKKDGTLKYQGKEVELRKGTATEIRKETKK